MIPNILTEIPHKVATILNGQLPHADSNVLCVFYRGLAEDLSFLGLDILNFIDLLLTVPFYPDYTQILKANMENALAELGAIQG